MSEPDPLDHVVVLTGGMGMGKSTIAKVMLKHGFYHCDTDHLVHGLYSNPPWFLYRAIERLVPDSAGSCPEIGSPLIDRAALGAAVMADPTLLPKIEELVGPHLIEAILTSLGLRSILDGDRAVSHLLDTPLYFEDRAADIRTAVETYTNKSGAMLATIAIVCEPNVQRERCMARSGMTSEKFDLLTSRQMPCDEKVRLADYVIDTSGSLPDTMAQVENILVLLRLRGFF